jgi:ABC-2 type transport system permease protein
MNGMLRLGQACADTSRGKSTPHMDIMARVGRPSAPFADEHPGHQPSDRAAANAVSVGPHGSPRRYFHSLWLLSLRDLKVRYATNWLGYLWSILDPLAMGLIFWFIFTRVFPRGIGEDPYIVYLMFGLLPWTWFTRAVKDSTAALTKDKRLVRSTGIPNSIWVCRVLLTGGISFVFSLPVLLVFLIVYYREVTPTWGLLWFPVAMLLQLMLILGLGLLFSVLCVLISDLRNIIDLVLRMMFYTSPILWSPDRLPESAAWVELVNPLCGILSLYRVGFFPHLWNTPAIVASTLISFGVLALGTVTFRTLIGPVLKEL